MIFLVAMMLATVTLTADDPSPDGARSLIDGIEASQRSVEDFRCEYEGKIYHKSEQLLKIDKHGDDGLAMTFSGTFIWKRGGDTIADSLHRRESDGNIFRQSLVMRAPGNSAEKYIRPNDAPIGFSIISRADQANANQSECFGEIFLIDEIKRNSLNSVNYLSFVSQGEIDGRPMKIINFTYNGLAGVMLRYWVDLSRNGQVARREVYGHDETVGTRTDIKLDPFKVNGKEYWMPTYGTTTTYTAPDGPRLLFTKDVAWTGVIYAVGGTMEFNKHPSAATFKVDYKLGTPISDNLRQLKTEFGRQKIDLKPTKAEARAMLDEHLAQAETQRSILVAADPNSRGDWTSWIIWGFGGATLTMLIALWIQRRSH